MGTLGVAEADPLADDTLGVEAIGEFVQMDRLVFERAPQPLDEDVVHAAAAAVHGDCHFGILEPAGEVEAGELAALVGIEDLRPAAGVARLIQGLDAEPGIHGVRQPPGQDRDQTKEAAADRDAGDVRAPDMVGALDGEALEMVRINPVFRVRLAGPRRPADRLKAHQPADTVTDHLPRAVERIPQEQLVEPPHQRQRLRTLPLRLARKRRPADRQNLALTAQAQARNIAAHHRPAHRLSPLAKKSRSTVS